MRELETVLLSSLLADDKAIAVGVMYPGDDTPSGIPLIRVADIVDGRISSKVGYRISEGVNSQYRRTQLSGDEVLMTLVGRPGVAIKVPPEMRGWNAARALAVLRLADPDERDFFVYSVASPQVQHTIRNWCNTTVQATLNLKEIKALPLPWPDLSTRRAIATVLAALDDKIELNRRMNETLEGMARAIFRDWFVDFGPTRAKMEGPAPYLAEDLWSLFPDTLNEATGLPEGWNWSTIGAEVEVVGGSTPSTAEPEYWDGDLGWATPKDLSALSAPVLLETARRITQQGLSKISSGLLPQGTVLLSSRAPIGYLAISEIPVAINQGFIAMRCGRRISNVHAWLWTKANMETILQKANGSTFQEISKGNFRPIPMLVPDDATLAAFDDFVVPLYTRIADNERETRTLAETRDYLLPRLMSGDVRVGGTG